MSQSGQTPGGIRWWAYAMAVGCIAVVQAAVIPGGTASSRDTLVAYRAYLLTLTHE